MKYVGSILFMSFFFFSCSDKGWSESAMLELLANCEEKSKHDSENEICSCVVDRFIQDFSFEEYTKMTEESITKQSNPEIYNKLHIYIGTTLDQCNISF